MLFQQVFFFSIHLKNQLKSIKQDIIMCCVIFLILFSQNRILKGYKRANYTDKDISTPKNEYIPPLQSLAISQFCNVNHYRFM